MRPSQKRFGEGCSGVKVLVAMATDLSVILESHMVVGENRLFSYAIVYVRICARTRTHTRNKYDVKNQK